MNRLIYGTFISGYAPIAKEAIVWNMGDPAKTAGKLLTKLNRRASYVFTGNKGCESFEFNWLKWSGKLHEFQPERYIVLPHTERRARSTSTLTWLWVNLKVVECHYHWFYLVINSALTNDLASMFVWSPWSRLDCQQLGVSVPSSKGGWAAKVLIPKSP